MEHYTISKTNLQSGNAKRIQPYQVMLYVLPQFNLTEFAAVTDVLRTANRICDTIQYEWWVISEQTRAVVTTSGIAVPAAAFSNISVSPDLVIFLGGESCDDTSRSLKSALHWLRRRKARVVILSDAVDSLIKVGALNNCKVSPHWKKTNYLSHGQFDLDLDGAISSESGRLTTSGGHVATYDVMLNLLVQMHGRNFANLISDYLLKGEIRENETPQRRNLRDRLGTSDTRILRAIELMEDSIEDVLAIADIAQDIGISQRQLERLFCTHLNQSPEAYYKGIRLKCAQDLLRQTSMSVIDIALSTGYATNSSFTRSYKRKFGQSPQEYRRSIRAYAEWASGTTSVVPGNHSAACHTHPQVALSCVDGSCLTAC